MHLVILMIRNVLIAAAVLLHLGLGDCLVRTLHAAHSAPLLACRKGRSRTNRAGGTPHLLAPRQRRRRAALQPEEMIGAIK